MRRFATATKLALSLGLAAGAALAASCATSLLGGDFPKAAPSARAPGAEAAADAPAKLRLLTFNIYNHPWERAARTRVMADTFRELQPDIVFLQEVSNGLFLPGDPSNELAEALGMKNLRFWHEQNWGLFKTGIAVLTRFPVLSSEYHDFAAHGFWNYKGYMLVRLGLPGGRALQVVNLHMASTGNERMRREEWQELKRVTDPLRAQGPVLVAGDFNTVPTNPSLQEFARETGARQPLRRLAQPLRAAQLDAGLPRRLRLQQDRRGGAHRLFLDPAGDRAVDAETVFYRRQHRVA